MSKVEDALKAANETQRLRIGSAVLSTISDLFRDLFPDKQAVVIADTTTYDVAGKYVVEILNNAGIKQVAPFLFSESDLYAEYTFVDRLSCFLKSTEAIPVAVGSGTINDLTKLSAHLVGRRYICVATAASMLPLTSA